MHIFRRHTFTGQSLLLILAFTFPTCIVAAEMPRSQWSELMSTTLPTMFCSEGSYFRECFSITAEQCEKTAASATRVCLEKSNDALPISFKTKDESVHWGNTIGTCAGGTFELVLTKKKILSDKCKNPT